MMAVTAGQITLSAIILAQEVVAKGIKALNHEGHEGHKESFSFPLCSLCALWFKEAHQHDCPDNRQSTTSLEPK